jgi:hypothetical protein
LLETDRIASAGYSLGVSDVEPSLLAKYANIRDVFSIEGASELLKANSRIRHTIMIEVGK